jgi:hypothetical protein
MLTADNINAGLCKLLLHLPCGIGVGTALIAYCSTPHVVSYNLVPSQDAGGAMEAASDRDTYIQDTLKEGYF